MNNNNINVGSSEMTYSLEQVNNVLEKLHMEGPEDSETGHSILSLKTAPKFGNFITYNEDFLNDLNSLGKLLTNYVAREKVKRPFNILLIAPPGSGKSFLVKQFTEAIPEKKSIRFEEYQVGTFYSIDNLYEILRRIQSYNLEEKVPIVFFDEIGSEVDLLNIFPYLLAPMFDGKFYLGGNYSYLGKAILVFAISENIIQNNTNIITDTDQYKKWRDNIEENLENTKKEKNSKIYKFSDFLDRIDSNIFLPNRNLIVADGILEREVIDISVNLIKTHFENISIIDFYALSIIATLLFMNETRRKAEQTVFLSENPGTSIFTYKSLPPRIHDKFDQLINLDEKRRFRIIA